MLRLSVNQQNTEPISQVQNKAIQELKTVKKNKVNKPFKSILQSNSLVNLDLASNVNLSLFEDVAEEHIHMPSLNYLSEREKRLLRRGCFYCI